MPPAAHPPAGGVQARPGASAQPARILPQPAHALCLAQKARPARGVDPARLLGLHRPLRVLHHGAGGPRRWTAAAAGPTGEDRLGCDRWLGGCGGCVRRHAYPSSWFVDRSARNWRDKRELFCGLRHMVLTTPSEWLRSEVRRSFLGGYPVYALPNGVDLTVFQPCSDEQFMRDVVRFYGLDGSGGAPPGAQRRGRVGRAQGAGRPD